MHPSIKVLVSDTVDQGVTFRSEAPPVSGINPQTKNNRPLTAPAVTRTACSNKSTITGKALIINPPLLVSSRCAGAELEPHTTQPVSRRLDPKTQRSGAKTTQTAIALSPYDQTIAWNGAPAGSLRSKH